MLNALDMRIPEWAGGLSERSCPLCESLGEQRVVRPDKLSVRECLDCGTWFVSPSPNDRQLTEFYSHYSATHQATDEARAATEILSSTPEGRVAFQELFSILDLSGKRCLDVGCGRGRHLHWLRSQGATTVGLELDQSAALFAQQRLGLDDIRMGTILDFDDGQFDVILMMDFIEHPLKPVALLNKAVELLDEGGILVMLTPNALSKAGGEQPVVFRVDLEHMQYFTTSSLHRLARDAGLSPLHLETYGFPSIGETDASLGSRIKSVTRALPFINTVRKIKDARVYRNLRVGKSEAFPPSRLLKARHTGLV